MKKSIIDTYETMYFIDIVVANQYSSLEELKELYTYSDGSELDNRILDGVCTTSTCKRKSDNKNISLVKYNKQTAIKGLDKHADMVNTIAHESGHVVLDIYEYISQNICNCSPEPFCYLLGYVAECLYKTFNKK